jgi:hypothetical protein
LLSQPRQDCSFIPAKVRDGERVRMIEGLRNDSGVAATTAIAGNALLQDDNGQLRVEFLQEQRRPQTGETRADDDDVSARIAGE